MCVCVCATDASRRRTEKKNMCSFLDLPDDLRACLMQRFLGCREGSALAMTCREMNETWTTRCTVALQMEKALAAAPTSFAAAKEFHESLFGRLVRHNKAEHVRHMLVRSIHGRCAYVWIKREHVEAGVGADVVKVLLEQGVIVAPCDLYVSLLNTAARRGDAAVVAELLRFMKGKYGVSEYPPAPAPAPAPPTFDAFRRYPCRDETWVLRGALFEASGGGSVEVMSLVSRNGEGPGALRPRLYRFDFESLRLTSVEHDASCAEMLRIIDELHGRVSTGYELKHMLEKAVRLGKPFAVRTCLRRSHAHTFDETDVRRILETAVRSGQRSSARVLQDLLSPDGLMPQVTPRVLLVRRWSNELLREAVDAGNANTTAVLLRLGAYDASDEFSALTMRVWTRRAERRFPDVAALMHGEAERQRGEEVHQRK